MSGYVLARVLPAPAGRFQDLAAACADSQGARFALAELNSWLASLGGGELQEAVASPPPALTPYLANYVAAMVEVACAQRGIPPPAWTGAIAPLAEPVFGSALASLRLHLLTHSPPPFRRRNIFIDSASAPGCEMAALTDRDLRRLFALLNEELRRAGAEGELFLVGRMPSCACHMPPALFHPGRGRGCFARRGRFVKLRARVALQAGRCARLGSTTA